MPLYINSFPHAVSDLQSVLDQSSGLTRQPSSQPGADTLEEQADKLRFFAELEREGRSPADYSDLNRQLGNTGLSSLTGLYVCVELCIWDLCTPSTV